VVGVRVFEGTSRRGGSDDIQAPKRLDEERRHVASDAKTRIPQPSKSNQPTANQECPDQAPTKSTQDKPPEAGSQAAASRESVARGLKDV
ncbi:hypothetical protein, partial [Propionimicrobium lymphophilum]|uniref:hypothetical protein n=1 Tax=Propionimicrobium lymphophilum TaxID=33012 RepID=UPI001E58B8C0